MGGGTLTVSLTVKYPLFFSPALGHLYAGRDKSDCPLPCTIVSTVVKSSFVHDNEGASGFELGFSEDVEVGSKYWFWIP